MVLAQRLVTRAVRTRPFTTASTSRGLQPWINTRCRPTTIGTRGLRTSSSTSNSAGANPNNSEGTSEGANTSTQRLQRLALVTGAAGLLLGMVSKSISSVLSRVLIYLCTISSWSFE